MRANRVPQTVWSASVSKGESIGFGNGTLLSLKFRDKRDVIMLSNLHTESTTRKRVRGRHESYIDRPDCISDYNKYMGGVDRADQILGPYEAARKTLNGTESLLFIFCKWQC